MNAMMKRRILSLLAVLLAGSVTLLAQQVEVPDGYELVDSLVYRPADAYDASLSGMQVFDYASDVDIVQSQAVRAGMLRHVGSNAGRKISGWRVRIYFDNKQDARAQSEAALKTFQARYPGYGAYRTFANPFFKVTAGDFRTKSEALELLERVRRDFPSAIAVKESISYPAADRHDSYITDTVKVLRQICSNKD